MEVSRLSTADAYWLQTRTAEAVEGDKCHGLLASKGKVARQTKSLHQLEHITTHASIQHSNQYILYENLWSHCCSRSLISWFCDALLCSALVDQRPPRNRLK
ncbi:hypothetical protein KIN20_009083 [Parelaphostrongylus tenuis]|uniref:Uncharacterized protein n=1 Tax=Parelaphostrongylus tenuis TaxID=148309 RepID=A0AAD5MRB6_PARTN|nr:hypothetical protein KIN20_009083 [Parelaphostrongylus tenuis]